MPNTIAQNLERLRAAKAKIAKAITNKGGTVPTGDGLEEFAADISTIAPYEMTGELPMVFKSDGENLRDYTVKGKNVRTANLFDKDAKDTSNGYVDGYYLSSNGGLTEGAAFVSEYIPVDSNLSYTISGIVGYSPSLCYYDKDKTYIAAVSYNGRETFTFTTPNSTKYVRISVPLTVENTAMLNVGTAPLPYEPYYDGIGERTANLFNADEYYGSYKQSDGTYSIQPNDSNNIHIPLRAWVGKAVTFSFNVTVNASTNRILARGIINGDAVDSNSIEGGTSGQVKITITPVTDLDYLVITYGSGGLYSSTFSNFQLELGSTATSYEPYGYKIPITCGNTTTNLYTPNKLYEGDTLTYAQTGVDIPTVDGINTLDTTLDTKFEMDIQYGDFPIYDNINAAINTLKGTETTYKPADMADAILDAIPDVEVSGDIVSVSDAAAYPAEKLEFAIEPVQAGSGDPSPTNVRPISGYTVVKLTRTGTNAWDEEWEVGDITSKGVPISASDRIRSKNFIPVKPNTTYYFKCPTSYARIITYDNNKNFVEYYSDGINNRTFTVGSNVYYIKFYMFPTYGTTYNHDISINYPSTDTEYHPYQGISIPITFPASAGTVYGGKADVVNGKLTVDRAEVILNGTHSIMATNWRPKNDSVGWLYASSITPNIKKSTTEYAIPKLLSNSLETISYNALYEGTKNNGISIVTTSGYGIGVRVSDVTLITETAINDWLELNPIKIVYELATPIEYDITPQQVQMLLGDNNIWCDTGDTTLEYKVDLGRFIAKLQATQAIP